MAIVLVRPLAKKLPKSMKEFISGNWTKMAVFSLSKKQVSEFKNSKKLLVQKIVFPKGFAFEEHSHERAQLLIVEKGFLTHFAEGKAFPQKKNELLVVPSFLPHTGISGDKEELAVFAFVKA